jgi:hypothetical protein
LSYDSKYITRNFFFFFFWLFVKIHILSLLILQLEEFRKKKAAEQAKKAASASQDHAFDIRPHQKQPLATEPVQRTDLDGAGTSDEPGQAVMGPSAAVTGDDNKSIGFPFKNEQDSLYDTTVTPPFSVKYSNAHSADSAQTDANNKNFERYGASGFVRSMDVNHSLETEGLNNDVGIYTGLRGKLPYKTATDHSSFYGRDGSQSTENRSSLMQSSVTNPGYSHDSTAKVSPQNSVGTLRQANPSNASTLISAHTSSSFYEGNLYVCTSFSSVFIY